MIDMNKKASGGGFILFKEQWPEMFSLLLLVVGFIIALFSKSAAITYIMITLCGLVSGRMLFFRKYRMKLLFFMVTIAFLIGFILGSFYGSTRYIIVFYIVGNYIGYFLHKEAYL
jgi:phage-related holin